MLVNLLADIYTRNLMQICILPCYSTPAAAVLNSAGDVLNLGVEMSSLNCNTHTVHADWEGVVRIIGNNIVYCGRRP